MSQKILFDARLLANPQPSGVGYYAKNLLKQLLRTNTTFDFFVFFNSFKSVDHEKIKTMLAPYIDRTSVTLVSSRYPNKFLSLSWALGHKPNIHSILDDADIIFTPHISVFRPTEKLRITTIHDLSYEKFPKFISVKDRIWHQYMAHSARFSEYFVADSYSTFEDLIKVWGIASERIKVIYPGVDDLALIPGNDFKHLQEKFNLKENYLLFLGDLEPRKNLVRLIGAFAQLKQHKDFKSHQLVLAGKQSFRFACIEKKIALSNLSPQDIVITGYLPHEDKLALLKHASLFVYPSLYEGFGLPILEAMQHNVPVLSSNISSIPELTHDAAVLIDPYDEKKILQGMLSILQNPTLRQELINKGKERCKLFSWQKSAKQLLSFWRELLP